MSTSGRPMLMTSGDGKKGRLHGGVRSQNSRKCLTCSTEDTPRDDVVDETIKTTTALQKRLLLES